MRTKLDQQDPAIKHNPVIGWPAILSIVLFNLAIILSGYFTYTNQKQKLTKRVHNDLNAVAVLKVKNVIQWREERIYNARIFFNNANFNRQLELFILSGSALDKENMETWLKIAMRDVNVDFVSVFDAQNRTIMMSPQFTDLTPPSVREQISKVKLSDSILFLDFFKSGEKVYLGLIIPICDKNKPEILTGKIFIRLNPEAFLFPFIEEWPTESETAETLLARRLGDSVQFLNRLQFGSKKPLEIRASIRDTNVAAVKGLKGFSGICDAIDYREEPILAAVYLVENTPWVLVSKEDKAEIFADLKSRLRLTLILIVVAIIIMTSLVLWFFRRQGLNYYRNLYQRQKEKDWLFDIMEHNLNEIYVFDADTLKFTFVNYGARHNLGYTLEELIDLTPVDIKPLVTRESFNYLVEPLITGEVKVLNFNTLHRRKDGTDYPVEVFLELMDSDRGKVFLAMINDITERVRIEKILEEKHHELVEKNKELETVNEELQVTVEELQQTGEELETTNEELSVNIQQISMLNKEVIAAKEIAETANNLKSTFLANMSHEIRTPLNGIMGFSELMVELAENPELQRMAQIIMNSSNRLLNTVNSILDISLLESGSLVVHPKKTNISDLINESIRLYSVFAEKKGIEITYEFHTDINAYADEDLTNKIINNLINNALKFTNEGSVRIELTSEIFNDQQWVTVSVSDTGIGISEQNMPYLFEEFRQFNEGLNKQHTGSGLGLNISKRYAEVMNGRLTASSSLGNGSTFTLWLPAAE
jgi:PAS domain S-box-containing protein